MSAAAKTFNRVLMRAGGCVVVLEGGGFSRNYPRRSFCDGAAMGGGPPPAVNRKYRKGGGGAAAVKGKRQEEATAAGLQSTTTPQLSMEVVNKTVEEVKQAQAAIGPFDQDASFGLMALLAKEIVSQATRGGKDETQDLSPMLVSPPLPPLRTRKQAEHFMEYAKLCEGAYDIQDDKEWEKAPKVLGEYGCWKLLASHPGGVCIPRFVVLRCDGGAGTRGRRRNRRILIVVRGTAEPSDAAINVAMTPGVYKFQGVEHQCHRGIVEAAAFLERMIRPIVWKAIDELKAEGIDPGQELEVIFTGHSLGGGTASIAALDCQGEFGPRVPVRAIGFATPACLSSSLADAPTTKRIVKTIVLGDDIIPRCSTRNLQELRIKAAGVEVDREMELMTEMIKGEMNRNIDDFTKHMTIMLTPPPMQNMLPPALAQSLSLIDKAGGLQGALQGMRDNVMPQQLNALKEKGATAIVDEALAEYQAALDAEIQHVQGQLERIKRDALDPFLPSSASLPSLSMEKKEKKVKGKQQQQQQEEEDDDEDDEAEEEELLNASNQANSKKLDMASFQATLQELLGEKSKIAQSVREQAEKTVREVIAQSSDQVEKVKEKAADTVQWVTNSINDFRRPKPVEGECAKEVKQAAQEILDPPEDQAAAGAASGTAGAITIKARVTKKEGEPKKTKKTSTKVEMVAADSIPLYPPGEIFWLKPKPKSAKEMEADTAGLGETLPWKKAKAILKQQGMTRTEFEIRRVRNPHFFDGIVLSPSMFTHHLLTQYIIGLNALKDPSSATAKKQ